MRFTLRARRRVAAGLMGLVAMLAVALVGMAHAGRAQAADSAGPDPAVNVPPGPMPPDCGVQPTGPVCERAAVSALNAARARLGQPAYALPADFTSLGAGEQALVLTNLDREQHGLPVIPGLTSALNAEAAAGVQADADPSASGPGLMAWTANWAGGFPNLPYAYEAWMYDDGPGSSNRDCTSAGAAGCWGHRHDILWRFSGTGTLAMGAAAGPDRLGTPGYATLLVQGDSAYQPAYTDTWAQAQGNGASGGTPSAPPRDASPAAHRASLRLRITGVIARHRQVRVTLVAPGGDQLGCALVPLRRGAGRSPRFRRCGRSVIYRRLRPGRYRFIVRRGPVRAGRVFSIR